jgi:superfamily II DNA/RNA helicase
MAINNDEWVGLGVPVAIASGLVARGIRAPFPIQAATLPDALAGRDICGKAPTGSGKTLAFGIAMAVNVRAAKPGRPRGLVLLPTRELALQVATEIAMLTKGSPIHVAAVYGGAGYGPQVKKARAASILVATPGRLEDLIERRDVHLGDVDVAVIDEADRMADMGFLPAVKRIMRAVRPERQTLLFSATLDGDINALIKEFQKDPARHEVQRDEEALEIDHEFWEVLRDERTKRTAQIIERFESGIVFCRTKHGCDRVARNLETFGLTTAVIHGNKSQAQRERSLQQFKQGKASVLVATDVAARGIHVDAVPCVVHFDLPEDPKDYVHRSGRTGRAGMKGHVFALVERSQRRAVAQMARAVGADGTIIDAPQAGGGGVVRPGDLGGVRVPRS